ncbi:TetR/AcrR family transcriptional regulator [Nocardioides sp. KR10-350]|uniref:TetR/AcrR family transcriptional regulator n=1 Tax=Nocardioides cheoyonin TaxID=3156615 RepID=UPI0032B369FA
MTAPKAAKRGADGRRARWDEHNESRRRRIVDAAVAAIEASEPGADIHVQQIAADAGLSRTVVYRHFEDRADLDRAVQQRILDSLWEELLPAVSLDGTVPQIIRRVVGTYVDWAVAHPALHRAAEHDPGGDEGSPLQLGMERLAGQIAEVLGLGVVAIGAEPSEEEAAALDPLVFGLVGAVFGAVRRWVHRSDRLSPSMLIGLTSRSIWYVLQGHARTLGVEIDPDVPLQRLLDPDPVTSVP